MSKIIIDSGYSSLKGTRDGSKMDKIPTNISFKNDSGIELNTINAYRFENEDYLIGEVNPNGDTFSTTDFQFKLKFEPLIIKNYRDFLEISDDEVPDIVLSLALVDWKRKDELKNRCSEYMINNKLIKNNIDFCPQGLGSYADFISSRSEGVHPSTAFVIDIGFNTVNVLYLNSGNLITQNCKGYPNHGVSSIIKNFTNYLESKYSMAYSLHESIDIFTKGSYKFQGVVQNDVTEYIEKLKTQFVTKLFNSILINDRKLISSSEVVIISGGGAYYLTNVEFPKNVHLVDYPYEFSNARGMALL